MDPIDLEEIRHLPIHEVLREYCRGNRTNIQDIDSLDNFCRVIKRIRDCLEESDFRTAGPLIHLGAILLKIESERLVINNLDEDERIRFIMERGPLYRMEVDLAIQEAVLSMLSRSKDKIVINDPGDVGGDVFGVEFGDLNRRRATGEEDLRYIIDDDKEFETIRIIQRQGC